MQPIANLLQAGYKVWWILTYSAIVESVLKNLNVKTKLLLPDVSRPFVLEIEYVDKGFGGVLL